jgi:DNA (cytosine-5)-methyltransferase 1
MTKKAGNAFIELFAGYGGLSLGLRSSGFHELMANELSSMPAETFALNLMGLDMRSPEFSQTAPQDRKVLWIDSSSDDVLERLVDNPFERPETDMPELSAVDDFEGRLIIGDVRRLNQFVEHRGRPLINSEVDLISGGPPCQSFSLAGRREFGNQRNQLPWEFARFVKSHQPRMVLLENVEGILRPFKLDNDTFYAWFEVCEAFAQIGYVTCPMLVNARMSGVAQNRPRFIMLAIRHDLASSLTQETANWFDQGQRLLQVVKNGENPKYDKAIWRYWDLTDADSELASQSVLHVIIGNMQCNSHDVDHALTNNVVNGDAVAVLHKPNHEHDEYEITLNVCALAELMKAIACGELTLSYT